MEAIRQLQSIPETYPYGRMKLDFMPYILAIADMRMKHCIDCIVSTKRAPYYIRQAQQIVDLLPAEE